MQHETAKFAAGIKGISVDESEDGTLFIEGVASDFETDRDLEAFESGAFTSGLKGYMENPVLLYHHDPSKALGRVTEAVLDRKNLRIRAEIPKPPAGSWAETVYQQVKGGIIRGFSVGGAFRRRQGADGRPRIFDVDLQEISVTPLPVNPRALFALAGKAFSAPAIDVKIEVDSSDLIESLDSIHRTLELVTEACHTRS